MSARAAPVNRKSQQRQLEDEKSWLATNMLGFDPIRSPAWLYLRQKIPGNLSKRELRSITKVLAKELDLFLGRNYSRRKTTMIKWIHDNFVQIHDFVETRVEFVYVNK
jgi:hypothetical protein